jgi:hypothetical protein
MTSLTQPLPHATTPSRPRTRRGGHATAREARTRRSFNAVFASYVRELATAADETSGAYRRPSHSSGNGG